MLDQSNNDISVVKLMSEYFQTLPGFAARIQTGTPSAADKSATASSPAQTLEMVESKEAAKYWNNDSNALLTAYQNKFGSFELNQSAVASMSAAVEIMLKNSKERVATDPQEPITAKQNDGARDAIRDIIIAPQLTAGANSFDPTVRSAALKLSAFLCNPDSSLVPITKNEGITRLKTAFEGKFLGMTAYGTEELNFQGFNLSRSRFDHATFGALANFSKAKLGEAVFRRVKFTKDSNWQYANRQNPASTKVEFASAKFAGKADFSGAQLQGSSFA